MEEQREDRVRPEEGKAGSDRMRKQRRRTDLDRRDREEQELGLANGDQVYTQFSQRIEQPRSWCRESNIKDISKM